MKLLIKKMGLNNFTGSDTFPAEIVPQIWDLLDSYCLKINLISLIRCEYILWKE